MRRIDPWLVVGLVALLVLTFVALYGSRLAPYEAIYTVTQPPVREPRPLSPGNPFVFGSDNLGRDLLSLVLIGARTTITIVVIAGLARLALGAALAVAASSSRPVRAGLDALGDVASALPSTIVAVLIVLFLAPRDTPAAVFVGALLVTGWAGPYRVLRSELLRLRAAQFTLGARALGVRAGALVLRHHVPHLVPVLATVASQQIVAALVALAELGMLGAFVGATRQNDPFAAISTTSRPILVSDVAEWGGLLANARSIENLYTTRWVFLVPGIAIAVAAIAFSLVGIGIARQYQRRNLLEDVRAGRIALAVAAIALVIAPSFVLPPRYPETDAWARDARAAAAAAGDVEAAFAAAGLRPFEGGLAVTRTVTRLQQSGPARLSIGGTSLREGWGPNDDFTPVLYRGSGGGAIEAPVVFMGFGIAPEDHPPRPTTTFGVDLGTLVRDWADDYAALDVRGKVAVILRVELLRSGGRVATGPAFEAIVASAERRGAAAVLFVDRQRASYERARGGQATNPYRRLGAIEPVERAQGMPAFVIDIRAADRILGSSGPTASEIYARADSFGTFDSNDPDHRRSAARDTGTRASIDLPVANVTTTSRSLVAATPNVDNGPALVIWAVAPSALDGTRGAADALAAVVRSVAGKPLPPMVFVLFDPSGEFLINTEQVAKRVGGRDVSLVVAIDALAGRSLSFVTFSQELLPIVDEYARRAAARAETSRATSEPTWPTGVSAFPRARNVLVRGNGFGADERVADAAAVVAYVIARYAARTPEIAP